MGDRPEVIAQKAPCKCQEKTHKKIQSAAPQKTSLAVGIGLCRRGESAQRGQLGPNNY
jgi:hypothetical protein